MDTTRTNVEPMDLVEAQAAVERTWDDFRSHLTGKPLEGAPDATSVDFYLSAWKARVSVLTDLIEAAPFEVVREAFEK